MGEVVTFYSYKGGVGRTMALANTAVILTQWGYRVLLVDWDLEAPGLEHFFKDFVDLKMIAQQPGVIDILSSLLENPSPITITWEACLVNVGVSGNNGVLHLLTAGTRNEHYFTQLRNLDLKAFYDQGGGFALEQLRTEWKQSYDYILVDSRTGVTDIGGICTIHLPDILVLLFTATEQSLQGVVEIARKANRARWKLPFDRMSLVSLPIPGKFDAGEEFKLSQEWLERFANALTDVYANWLPKTIDRRDFLQLTKIPYISYFSFGEKLPVLEQGTIDPAGLGYAYENLAALIAHNLESVHLLLESRSEFVRSGIRQAGKFAPAGAARSARPLRVFISYAPPDQEAAHNLYRRLRDDGFQPWMDAADLLPGQNLRRETEKAVRTSDAIILTLSHNAVSRSGQFHRQVKLAMDVAEEQPENAIFIIPVRLDSSEMPNSIANFHFADLTREDGYSKLVRALRMRAETRT